MESIREIRDIPRQFTTNIRHQATKQASSELQRLILTNFFLLLVMLLIKTCSDNNTNTYFQHIKELLIIIVIFLLLSLLLHYCTIQQPRPLIRYSVNTATGIKLGFEVYHLLN